MSDSVDYDATEFIPKRCGVCTNGALFFEDAYRKLFEFAALFEGDSWSVKRGHRWCGLFGLLVERRRRQIAATGISRGFWEQYRTQFTPWKMLCWNAENSAQKSESVEGQY